jgi:hypothetical protein
VNEFNAPECVKIWYSTYVVIVFQVKLTNLAASIMLPNKNLAPLYHLSGVETRGLNNNNYGDIIKPIFFLITSLLHAYLVQETVESFPAGCAALQATVCRLTIQSSGETLHI